jgi:DNA-binding MarR family transcriptional regulator
MASDADSLSPVEVFRRLMEGGLDEREALRVLTDSVDLWDRLRKERGSRRGPLGLTASRLYEHLAFGPGAFAEFTPYRGGDLAHEVRLSRGTIARAMTALEAHGFIALRKIGYSFSYRLLLPRAALRDYVEYNSDPILNDQCRDLAARVSELFVAGRN